MQALCRPGPRPQVTGGREVPLTAAFKAVGLRRVARTGVLQLHGHHDRRPAQSRHPRFLPPLVLVRRTLEDGVRRRHARAASHPEHRNPGLDPLAVQPRAHGWRSLTSNTVTEQLPNSCPNCKCMVECNSESTKR